MGRTGKAVLLLVAAGLCVFAVAYGFLLMAKAGELSVRPEEPSPQTASGEEIPASEDEWVRILVCGIDDTQMLTDVIFYGAFQVQEGKAAVLQIPRDSFVGGDYPSGKINAVYGHPTAAGGEGIRELENVLMEQFLLPVDYYVTVTLEGFRNMVDSLGGVEMEVPFTIEYLPGKVLYAGRQVLSGQQAEWLVRYRKGYAMGDLGRVEMQEEFLKALFETVHDQGRVAALSAVVKNYSQVSTDLPLGKMLSLAQAAFELEEEDITFYLAQGTGAMYGTYAVYQLDAESLAQTLNEAFRPAGEEAAADDLRVAAVPLQPQPEEELWEENPSLWEGFLLEGGEDEEAPPISGENALEEGRPWFSTLFES